jgi:hypothetical protein
MTRVTSRPWGDLDFAEQVRQARPFAQEILVNHGVLCDPTPGLEVIVTRVAHLMGDKRFVQEYEEWSVEELRTWSDRLEAALVLGIALGLLLRPEAFARDAQQ